MEVLMLFWPSCACSFAFPCLQFACGERQKTKHGKVPQNPWRGLWAIAFAQCVRISREFRAVSCAFISSLASGSNVAVMAGRRICPGICRTLLAASLVLQLIMASVPSAKAQTPLGPFVPAVAGHYAGPMVTLNLVQPRMSEDQAPPPLHCPPQPTAATE